MTRLFSGILCYFCWSLDSFSITIKPKKYMLLPLGSLNSLEGYPEAPCSERSRAGSLYPGYSRPLNTYTASYSH